MQSMMTKRRRGKEDRGRHSNCVRRPCFFSFLSDWFDFWVCRAVALRWWTTVDYGGLRWTAICCDVLCFDVSAHAIVRSVRAL